MAEDVCEHCMFPGLQDNWTICVESISSQWWLPVQFSPLRVRYSKDVNIQNSQLSFTEWLLDTLKLSLKSSNPSSMTKCRVRS